MLRRIGIGLGLGCLLIASGARAIVNQELDDFGVGGLENWQRGMIAIGGPANPSDPFLLLTADGSGSLGKLVSFNQAQWSGDYLAAGIQQISVWFDNLGATGLQLRLVFGDTSAPGPSGTSGSWYATAAEPLPAGSGWKQVDFDIGPSDLVLVQGSASYTNVMQGVVTLRIMHSPTGDPNGQDVVATLGVDRIVAVPEPGSTALGVAALGALVLCARSRRARGA